jgi:hypothetical protein
MRKLNDLVLNDGTTSMSLTTTEKERQTLRKALIVYLNVTGEAGDMYEASQLLVDLDFIDGRRKNNAPGMPAWASTRDR